MTRRQIRKARVYAAIVAFRYDYHDGSGKSYGRACRRSDALRAFLLRHGINPNGGGVPTIIDRLVFTSRLARKSSTFRRVYAAMEAKYIP